MTDEWRWERILITVRAYPEPSQKYAETSCVAGVTEDGHPIRLFPIPGRHLKDERRFKKWSIIEAKVRKAPKDTRPESHNIDADSIKVVGHIDTKKNWANREEFIEPFRLATSIEELLERYEAEGRSNAPSLALLRPSEISRFVVEVKDESTWSDEKRAYLARRSYFDDVKRPDLEYIPYHFRYWYRCDDPRCTTIHKPAVLDWEINEAYRTWRPKYGEDRWEEMFRMKFEHLFMKERDLQFFVGTLSSHPKSWTIIGLYYPKLTNA